MFAGDLLRVAESAVESPNRLYNPPRDTSGVILLVSVGLGSPVSRQ